MYELNCHLDIARCFWPFWVSWFPSYDRSFSPYVVGMCGNSARKLGTLVMFWRPIVLQRFVERTGLNWRQEPHDSSSGGMSRFFFYFPLWVGFWLSRHEFLGCLAIESILSQYDACHVRQANHPFFEFSIKNRILFLFFKSKEVGSNVFVQFPWFNGLQNHDESEWNEVDLNFWKWRKNVQPCHIKFSHRRMTSRTNYFTKLGTVPWTTVLWNKDNSKNQHHGVCGRAWFINRFSTISSNCPLLQVTTDQDDHFEYTGRVSVTFLNQYLQLNAWNCSPIRSTVGLIFVTGWQQDNCMVLTSPILPSYGWIWKQTGNIPVMVDEGKRPSLYPSSKKQWRFGHRL